MDYIAVDLGAESGRVMIGTIANDKLTLKECHRFPNGPYAAADGSLHWDWDKLMGQIKTGLKIAIPQCAGKPAGIGVDTWGVDFGLIGPDGKLLDDPYNYRDSRTDGMMDIAFEKMGKRAVYDNTGIQFMQFNSVYQLLSMRLSDHPLLKKAKMLLFVADLISYLLCGRAYAEYTFASTSQIMDMKTGKWSEAIIKGLDLPGHLLPEIMPTGTVVGKLTPEICAELECGPIPVIATAAHDTGSAVAGVPAKKGTSWAYLSSGTWSLMGIETPHAIVNDKTFEYQFTNEGGVNNTIRLLKNIMGLWIVQECRRQWQREGADLSYAELTKMAAQAKPFAARIDPDCKEFLAPCDMPARINDHLKSTGQQPITDKGQMVRVILESLARKYGQVLRMLEDLQGKKIDVLHIVGGGIRNELLNQFTADATGCKVITGPVEATASGNIVVQAMATGDVKDLWHARQIVSNSYEIKEYLPQNPDAWK
jgi:sugar (pentulose or hexulose) kinase